MDVKVLQLTTTDIYFSNSTVAERWEPKIKSTQKQHSILVR